MPLLWKFEVGVVLGPVEKQRQEMRWPFRPPLWVVTLSASTAPFPSAPKSDLILPHSTRADDFVLACEDKSGPGRKTPGTCIPLYRHELKIAWQELHVWTNDCPRVAGHLLHAEGGLAVLEINEVTGGHLKSRNASPARTGCVPFP